MDSVDMVLVPDEPEVVKLTEVNPKLPAANQGRSTFMSLPAEIRLKILQELLVTKRGKLGSKSSFHIPHKSEHTEPHAYGLSPAILGTCQQLLNEGLPLLYGRNTLVIFTTRFGTPLLGFVPEHLAEKQVAEKFDYLETWIDMYTNPRGALSLEDVEGIAEELGPFVNGASLCVNLEASGLTNLSYESMPKVVEGLKHLRCKETIINGIEKEDAEGFVRVITGGIDLKEPFNNFTVLLPMRELYEEENGKRLVNLYREMATTVRNADAEGFERIGREMLAVRADQAKTLEKMLDGFHD